MGKWPRHDAAKTEINGTQKAEQNTFQLTPYTKHNNTEINFIFYNRNRYLKGAQEANT